ncbi:protein-glutamine gamma-glutamyltransferase 2-like [Arapaima gigas]
MDRAQHHSTLRIVRWDLECKLNNKSHHTQLNGVDRLIVRRGQPFSLTLYLGGSAFQLGVTTLSFIAETGPYCSEEKGTKAIFKLSKSVSKMHWSTAVCSIDGDKVTLSICSPPDAPIGLYRLTLVQAGMVRLGKFTLLFNPWCPNDAVYLDNKQQRNEYVLSQDGLIFMGTPNYITEKPWKFGQFESGILDACLRILDENPKYLKNPAADCSMRGSPVYISRVLSAMINSNDDRGVLEGRWTGSYAGGKHPAQWSDSTEILRLWNKTSCNKVRFGQCWVFAAVACTVSRALGIPSRVVTNFQSAHDSNSNLKIERYHDENGRSLDSRDSIWNFHVWVESWMTRPDLEPGYEGWQASDPTPQEKSEGVFCCGPVSLQAIKEGELTMKYDTPFVFAEVNADVVDYVKLRNGSLVQIGGSSTQVGQKISTKMVGSDTREDITHLYKYPEGSERERQVFEKANHHNKLQQMGAEPRVRVRIKVSEDMRRGKDFDVFAVVTNKTSQSKVCQLKFYAQAVSYSGKLGACIERTELGLNIPPSREKRVSLTLSYHMYGEATALDNMIRIVALVTDRKTGEYFGATRTIALENPEIKIKVLGRPQNNSPLAAEISLQNPLPEMLENCSFSLGGGSLMAAKAVERIGSLNPGQEAKVTMHFTPVGPGMRKLLVDFNSDKLCNIKGFKNIFIEN